MYTGFTEIRLDERSSFFHGSLPSSITHDRTLFDVLWDLHPDEFHEIMIHGKLVKTPRWQQAYGRDYRYTNRVNLALPIAKCLEPFFSWGRESIDPRLNGILINWYEGTLGHYIGKHRDSTANLVEGTPIVTISLGEDRLFRLRPWKERGIVDFDARNGTVFIMPYETNLAWTHEVPRRAKDKGRRLSITLRAFS